MDGSAARRGLRCAPGEVWAAVRQDYLAGMSATECCRRHGVGLTTLRSRAAREGWRRQDQAWTPPLRLDPDDEGAELDLQVEGDLDRIGLNDLIYVAHRRVMRAVLRGEAAAALRWRRVQTMLEIDQDEMVRESDREEALSQARREPAPVPSTPAGSDGWDGSHPSPGSHPSRGSDRVPHGPPTYYQWLLKREVA